MTDTRLETWERRTTHLLTLSALAFLIAYAVPILWPDVSTEVKVLCGSVVAATWVAIIVDFVVRLGLSDQRWQYVRKHPLDVAVIVLPMLRPLQLLRLVALIKVLNKSAGSQFRGQVGMYVGVSVTLIVGIAGLAILDAEQGHPDANITSIGDALWWSMTTITTVGYGDQYPVTTTGRFIAVALMIAGIAMLGVITASLASWLIERVEDIDTESHTATRRDIHELEREIVRLRQELAGSTPSDRSTR